VKIALAEYRNLCRHACIDEQGGRQSLVRGGGGEGWRIEQRAGLLRVAGDGDDATPWRTGPFVARPTATDGFVQYNGKRYRGELWFTPTDTGILVVNQVPLEDYLRGVVPLEMGTRQPTDRPPSRRSRRAAMRTSAYRARARLSRRAATICSRR
jgi:stage II sporulation protein D